MEQQKSTEEHVCIQPNLKTTIKWLGNITEVVVDSVEEALADINRTVTVGLTGHFALAFGLSYNAGIAIDARGNVALQATGNVGGGLPAATPIALYTTVTNAPSYEELVGPGYQVGGSGGVKFVSVGGEAIIIPPAPGSGDESYYGGSINLGISLLPYYAELHGEVGKTVSTRAINIFDLIRSGLKGLEGW